MHVSGEFAVDHELAAIGLEVNLRQLVTVGGRALIAGLLSTVALGLGGLMLLTLLFQLARRRNRSGDSGSSYSNDDDGLPPIVPPLTDSTAYGLGKVFR